MMNEPAHRPGESPANPGMNAVAWAERVAEARVRRERVLAARKVRAQAAVRQASPDTKTEKQALPADPQPERSPLDRAADLPPLQAVGLPPLTERDTMPAPPLAATADTAPKKSRAAGTGAGPAVFLVICVAMAAALWLALQLPEPQAPPADPQSVIAPRTEPKTALAPHLPGSWQFAAGRTSPLPGVPETVSQPDARTLRLSLSVAGISGVEPPRTQPETAVTADLLRSLVVQSGQVTRPRPRPAAIR